MTNGEFYKDELKVIKKGVTEDLLIDKIAVNKQGQPKYCRTQPCADCIFNGHCALEAKKQWLKQEHVEQVDWSKVKVDTPILVKNTEKEEWKKRHFARFKNGKVYAWYDGLTSWSTAGEDDVNFWKYAKLAERED